MNPMKTKSAPITEEEFDEEAYMRQLQKEEFECELRWLTMDSLSGSNVIDFL